MKTLQLEGKKRMTTGRKVKNLRKDGILPATVYGRTINPLSVEIKTDEFIYIFKQSGETGLISLMVDGETHPVLIKNVQFDPVSDIPLHVEFHQVNLKEKIRAHVPVDIIGESQSIKEKTGTLLQLLSEIEVEALPTDLPEHIQIDISGLANVNDHLLVRELTIPDNVILITDPDIMVVKIGELVAPEPEPVAAPIEGEATLNVETSIEEKGTEEKKESSEKSEESSKKE